MVVAVEVVVLGVVAEEVDVEVAEAEEVDVAEEVVDFSSLTCRISRG